MEQIAYLPLVSYVNIEPCTDAQGDKYVLLKSKVGLNSLLHVLNRPDFSQKLLSAMREMQ